MPPFYSNKTAKKKAPINTGAAAGSQAAARKAAAAALAATMGVKTTPKTAPLPPKQPIKIKGAPKSKAAAANALAGLLGPKMGGPPPAAGGAGKPGEITDADKASVAQYIKMMKMKIPEGAVRQKMAGDSVPQHLQDFVLSGGKEPEKNKYGLFPHEEEIAVKYRKMIKMKLPEPAVKHKMTADGVAENIIKSVLAGEPAGGGGGGAPKPAGGGGGGVAALFAARAAPAAASSGSPEKKAGGKYSSLTPTEEKRATPYRKMLKMGLPEGAVRQKMSVEGASEAVIASVLAGEVPDPDKKWSQLSPEEEAVATPYRKMLKMGLPEGAVRQKMAVEGASDAVVNSVIAREIPDPDAASAAVAPTNSMANALSAMANGGLKEVEEMEGGAAPSSSSNPASALAMAAAAASKRRTMSGDELALEIERKANANKSTATSSDPTSALAAAAAAARKNRASGDSIALDIEAQRKARLQEKASGNANFGAMLKKAPRKARSEFTASSAPHLSKNNTNKPIAPPRPAWMKKSAPQRSKSDFSKLPAGMTGLTKKPQPQRGVFPSTSAHSADSVDRGASRLRRVQEAQEATIETSSISSEQQAPFGPIKLRKGRPRPPPAGSVLRSKARSDFTSGTAPSLSKTTSPTNSAAAPVGPAGLKKGRPRPAPAGTAPPHKSASDFTSGTAPSLAKNPVGPALLKKGRPRPAPAGTAPPHKAASDFTSGTAPSLQKPSAAPRAVYGSSDDDESLDLGESMDFNTKMVVSTPNGSASSLQGVDEQAQKPVPARATNSPRKGLPAIFTKKKAGSPPRPPLSPQKEQQQPAAPAPVTVAHVATETTTTTEASNPVSVPSAGPSPSRMPKLFRKSQSQPRVSATDMSPPLTDDSNAAAAVEDSNLPPAFQQISNPSPSRAPKIFRKSQSQPRVSGTSTELSGPPLIPTDDEVAAVEEHSAAPEMEAIPPKVEPAPVQAPPPVPTPAAKEQPAAPTPAPVPAPAVPSLPPAFAALQSSRPNNNAPPPSLPPAFAAMQSSRPNTTAPPAAAPKPAPAMMNRSPNVPPPAAVAAKPKPAVVAQPPKPVEAAAPKPAVVPSTPSTTAPTISPRSPVEEKAPAAAAATPTAAAGSGKKKKKQRVRKQKKGGAGGKTRSDGTDKHCIVM